MVSTVRAAAKISGIHRDKLAPHADVACQRASLLGMPGAQVDLVFRAVKPEADGAVGRTAIKVIDHLDLSSEPRHDSSCHWPGAAASPIQAA